MHIIWKVDVQLAIGAQINVLVNVWWILAAVIGIEGALFYNTRMVLLMMVKRSDGVDEVVVVNAGPEADAEKCCLPGPSHTANT